MIGAGIRIGGGPPRERIAFHGNDRRHRGRSPGLPGERRMLLDAEGYEVVGEAATGEAGLGWWPSWIPTWCCWTSSCPTRTAFRWPPAWPAPATRGRWCWCPAAPGRTSGRQVEGSAARGFIPKSELSRRRAGGGHRVIGLRRARGPSAWRASSPVRCRWCWRFPRRTTSTTRRSPRVFGPLIGWSFIGTGLFAWYRRPENNFGALMAAVGFTWCVSGLAWTATPTSSSSATCSRRCPSRSSSTCCGVPDRAAWRAASPERPWRCWATS